MLLLLEKTNIRRKLCKVKCHILIQFLRSTVHYKCMERNTGQKCYWIVHDKVHYIEFACILSYRTQYAVMSYSVMLYCNRNTVLLVFSVNAIQNRSKLNQNRSINKVQNLGNERRYIYKDPRQDSGQSNISYTRNPTKCFTQTYRDLYGDAMLVLTWMSSNMADGNQQKHLLPSFATKA